jgi:hypothetical protein
MSYDDGYGSTTYYGNDDSSFDTGVANATGPIASAPPDASGGAGSFLSGLLPTLTNGLNAVLAANLNDKFGEGIASGLATVDANGNLVYKATPAPIPTTGQVLSSQALSSPVLLIGGVAVALILVIALTKK